MGIQTLVADESLIGEKILSTVCWDEHIGKQRPFNYTDLVAVIAFLKNGRARHTANNYTDAVSYALEELRIPESTREVIRALASKAFKLSKDSRITNPLADKHWAISIEEQTREIHLTHYGSMSSSDSVFWQNGFDVGAISIDGRPCRMSSIAGLHRQKCAMVVYEIMSGRR